MNEDAARKGLDSTDIGALIQSLETLGNGGNSRPSAMLVLPSMLTAGLQNGNTRVQQPHPQQSDFAFP